MNIHPTAVISPAAKLGDVTVGPYTVIGPNVCIDDGTVVGPSAVIDGHTTIGKNNKIFQFSSLGSPPQDLKYKDEPIRNFITYTCKHPVLMSG